MSEKIKILIIAAHSGKGLVHVDKLIPGLVNAGYHVTFYGWDRKKEYPKSYHENGVDYKMIFSGWGFANKWLVVALPLFILKAFLELAMLKKGKYRSIMAIDLDSALPQAWASFFNRTPFIYNVRDNYAMRTTLPGFLKPIIKKLDRYIIRKARNIIVPDENRITSEDQNEKEKFHVIYNGALDVVPPDNIPKERLFTVYAMGYLMKTRGIELLLDLEKQLPDVRILLAGVVQEDDLMERIKTTPGVDYRGWMQPEDALKLCFESDLIFTFYDPVSEINRKAASNKWFDAMMAKKPILVNEEVERSAWIMSNEIGYCCPYGDVDALVRLIMHVRSNPEEAQLKGENGRRLYEKGYSWESSLKQIDSLIRGM